jgi:energy-coupling factor transporter ATP-binding protein EcfA2
MVVDNPFRASRLGVAEDFRAAWDVPELNHQITDWLVGEVKRLKGRKEPDPGQMIALMTGPPGYGKTHLFGRIEHIVGDDVFFVFVPAFVLGSSPLDHIRWHVVEALFRRREGLRAPIEMALARICRSAFVDYFADLPPTLRARHQTMYRRLDESAEAVVEITSKVKDLDPFLKLADSLTHVLATEDAQIVRALALGWCPAPWSAAARRWLQGQDLPDADREALRLSDEAPTPLSVIRTIPALFRYDQPMMICCDQIEGLLQGSSSDAINQFSTAMMDLLHAVPVQLVMSLFEDKLEQFFRHVFAAFKMRVRQPYFTLDEMNSEHAIKLVKARLADWPARDPVRPSWPFNEAAIHRLVREKQPTPRMLIQTCERRFGEWLETDQKAIIENLNGEDGVDRESMFVREWEREIEEIRRKDERSADRQQEERLYRGVLEALKLAQSVQRSRPFGGVRILEVQPDAVKSTPTAKRNAASITVKSGSGNTAIKVLVSLTTLEAARSLGAYFRAIYAASADPVAGALVIHPRRDLTLGPAGQTAFDQATAAGKLRLMPLEDFATTYQATECLVALLDRAAQRELVLDGQTLSPEDCRDYVIKTGVIENLDLFKMLGGWGASHQEATQSIHITPSTDNSSTPPKTEPAFVPPAIATPITTTTTVEPPLPSKPDLGGWAAEKLAAAVKKLNLLSQNVQPDGFEVGPTFARLRVKPVGKTNFKGVSNKAVDLRISLGLEVVPIVGSQAGCISIDIQRPDRTTVPIAITLADCPSDLSGKPAFPVGQDVAGQTHWLNLADPTNCHVLVAGTTGSGKSEFLKAIIAALASRLEPDQLQFILIDPKRVTFNLHGQSPYLRAPIAYDIDAALPVIESCKAEMERRYTVLQQRKLSDVSELPKDFLPRIVIVIDEFASFLEDKETKKIVNDLLKRIGAMARAAGIHLILSTQRPDKDVITPLLRENLPGRIALRVSSKAGSDLILDSPEAEHLLGRGDLFWKTRGELLRLQSPFVERAELERVLRCTV